MAKQSKVVETPSQTTAVVSWEEEMAREARVAAAMVAGVGGNVPKFSIQGGMLSLDSQAVPGNAVAAVIVDQVLENTFYTGDFDRDNVKPPVCFAIGRDDETMVPHPDVVARGQAQNATCRGCPMNAFGSADRGKGKACKNRARLVVLHAGEFDASGRFVPTNDVEAFSKGMLAMFSVPPTSIGAYATYVKQIAATVRRPPYGVFTKIKVTPDPKVQVRVSFESLDRVPDAFLPAIMARAKEARPLAEQGYNLDVEDEKLAARAPGKKKY
jgi:hypothetical protein